MEVTNQDLKDLFDLDDTELQEVYNWLEPLIQGGANDDPIIPQPVDLIKFIRKDLEHRALKHARQLVIAEATKPRWRQRE